MFGSVRVDVNVDRVCWPNAEVAGQIVSLFYNCIRQREVGQLGPDVLPLRCNRQQAAVAGVVQLRAPPAGIVWCSLLFLLNEIKSNHK